MRKAALRLAPLLLLAGCAVDMTPSGRMVRQIPNAVEMNCQFLGVVEARGSMRWDAAENRRHALNQIRNQVAELGGNAFSLSQNDITGLGAARSQGNAFRCPDSGASRT